MAKSDIKHSIKKDRLSHISAPVNDDAEFHLRDKELSIVPKDGETGFICFPVECVNHGDDSGIPMHRFVQTGKADFHYEVKNTSKNSDKDAKLKKYIKETY